MKLPHYISRKSWPIGSRVVVATGEHRGKHGTVKLFATKHNYLVLLDGENRPRQFHKGALDPEK
jgi:ribosomal protein L24